MQRCRPAERTVRQPHPEAVLRSPIQEVASPALPRNMVPVEMVDYMEPSPIGRAEWILLLGELFGRRDEARKVFDKPYVGIDGFGCDTLQ